MIFIGYKKCSTCKNAEKLLKDKGIDYEYREIDKDNPKKVELKEWHESSKLDIKKFFNTSGMIYREKNLKDKLPDLTDEEKYELLASDGMLVKRPILLDDKGIFLAVGSGVKKYLEEL